MIALNTLLLSVLKVWNSMLDRLPFQHIWIVDFEFIAKEGERPDPVCMVAFEVRSGTYLMLWRDELTSLNSPPFDTTANSLFVAFYSSAELGCFLALNWPMPERILDLYVEFLAETNGHTIIANRSLVGALLHYGLPTIGADAKDSKRNSIQFGGPWNEQGKREILDCCQSHVDALLPLLNQLEAFTEVSAFFLEKKQERNLSQPQPINKLFQHKENLMVKSQP